MIENSAIKLASKEASNKYTTKKYITHEKKQQILTIAVKTVTNYVSGYVILAYIKTTKSAKAANMVGKKKYTT